MERGLKQRAWKIYYKTGKIKTKGKYRNDEEGWRMDNFLP